MILQKFLAEERGAATVDWVVLTGCCVGMGIAVTDITSNAMSGLSQEVRSELTNTDPSRNYFDELMNLAIFSDYVAYSDSYGSDWNENGRDDNGNNWAQAAYSLYASMDDVALYDNYEYHYEVATSFDGDPNNFLLASQSVDHVAIAEYVLSERGLATPETNDSAEEVRALYAGESS